MERMMHVRSILEAILFVAEEPLDVGDLAEVVEQSRADVERELEGLAADLHDAGRGIVLRRIAGGWRLYSAPEARSHLERFARSESAARFSRAALEALAVVAYKQPVSRGQVGEVRGVDSERALRTLERRGMIEEVGRAPGPGQAVLYGTTALFLEKLGIDSLDDLPPLADHVPPSDVVESLERPFRPEEPSNASTS
jgi:segregation and condensation protein B